MVEDRRAMSLMARNDSDGTFTKLALLRVNLVGTVLDLRKDVESALKASSNPNWQDKKFVLMKETLKDIKVFQEEKFSVSEVYTSECVLIRWKDGAIDPDGKMFCPDGVINFSIKVNDNVQPLL